MEEFESKYSNEIQKDINSTCFKLCFNRRIKGHDEKCHYTCTQKYIDSLSVMHKEFKKEGYKSHSLYAYKMFPEPSFIQKSYYNGEMIMEFGNAVYYGFKFNRNVWF